MPPGTGPLQNTTSLNATKNLRGDAPTGPPACANVAPRSMPLPMTELNEWLGEKVDSRISTDPDDPHFAVSFGGEAFFVVGLHPNASRPARRFDHAVMVFNLHDQFERLRAEGRYDGLRSVILKRDKVLAGSLNPMLAQHGEISAARQYSGRAVEDNWACPFSRKSAAA